MAQNRGGSEARIGNCSSAGRLHLACHPKEPKEPGEPGDRREPGGTRGNPGTGNPEPGDRRDVYCGGAEVVRVNTRSREQASGGAELEPNTRVPGNVPSVPRPPSLPSPPSVPRPPPRPPDNGGGGMKSSGRAAGICPPRRTRPLAPQASALPGCATDPTGARPASQSDDPRRSRPHSACTLTASVVVLFITRCGSFHHLLKIATVDWSVGFGTRHRRCLSALLHFCTMR